jgi:hypothetical protein
MITLNIKKVEKKLGRKLQKNSFCLGVDTAATTGLALITTTETDLILETDIFKLPILPRKIADQMIKAEKYEQSLDSMINLIREFKKKYETLLNTPRKDSILVLEQSYMFNNPETFGILRAEAGLMYSEFYDLFSEIKVWLATVVRKIVGFQSIYSRSDLQHLKPGKRTEKKKLEIVNWVNNKLGTEIEDNNIADAVILSLAGIIKEGGTNV